MLELTENTPEMQPQRTVISGLLSGDRGSQTSASEPGNSNQADEASFGTLFAGKDFEHQIVACRKHKTAECKYDSHKISLFIEY